MIPPDAASDEAVAWVTRLNDPHGAADREAFEQWLAKDPAHRRAYERVSASYASSAVLRTSMMGKARNLEAAFPRSRGLVLRLAAAAIAALVILGAYELSRAPGVAPLPLETVMLASGEDGRAVTLADGSKVTMAPASEVRIDLGRSERRAEVRKGRVRLTIAREQRPFRIIAGAASTRANAGEFEAAIVAGQGIVTSAMPTDAGQRGARPPPANMATTLEFDAEPLGTAIERINQARSGPRLEVDPRFAHLRVTGAFRQGSSDEIAGALASAFRLQLTRTPAGALRLGRDK